MTILLVLLGLLIILVVLRLFAEKNTEGFQNIELNPATVQGYNNFLSFYNPFCASWQKAISSSAAAEIPQQPLTDPSQVQSSAAPAISTEDMNKYITKLSGQLSQPMPPICSTMPATIDSSSIVQVTSQIPKDIQPYINALKWMNGQLQKAQANLGSALQGQPTEGFEDMCQDISQCLANNPGLVQQIAMEMTEQSTQQIVQQEENLMKAIMPFLNTPELSDAFGENVILMEKAQEIQNQAQSGDLVNQINVPGGNTIAKYQKPDGANNLQDMKQNNPNRYNELKQNYSQWFDIKNMLDQINATL
jgi:hypothetical protein